MMGQSTRRTPLSRAQDSQSSRQQNAHNLAAHPGITCCRELIVQLVERQAVVLSEVAGTMEGLHHLPESPL